MLMLGNRATDSNVKKLSITTKETAINATCSLERHSSDGSLIKYHGYALSMLHTLIRLRSIFTKHQHWFS